ncbi:FLUCTUATING-LIGHT-ACCLIMATION protein 1, chloroplastic-like [Castanea sativa]|uniref:FLUCTUATING-LIGHT-ACCLIMATION protein 1, chloroplastic-like n=1 Tax=Castanea sativa TaxID=21020 RepID=UPI003F64D797
MDLNFINPDRSLTTFGGYYYHGNTIMIDGNLGFVLFGIIMGICLLIVYLNRPRVLKIQVGLSGMAHSIQRELSTLATTVDTSENKSCNFFLSNKAYLFQRELSTLTTAIDTSKNKSFHFFLTESAVALLRHRKYWISGYSSVVRRWSLKAVEKEFRQLSTDERVKYDIELLVNVDNMKVQRTIIPRDNEVEKNYIVVFHLLWVQNYLLC